MKASCPENSFSPLKALNQVKNIQAGCYWNKSNGEATLESNKNTNDGFPFTTHMPVGKQELNWDEFWH